ncbi:hypothetical protein M407DRAFT_164668 [Tulasnella calospora MUT 4182]|uniref:Uncharacterized protein n=1 Tax=Tulasnella calospora MUT 4182 TaxID=1051891 RepID=A0A0C3L723_9AGAM|nr:hypothetical protein M407DRAFT_164668 [Tulasnella calospora MUT 4182]
MRHNISSDIKPWAQNLVQSIFKFKPTFSQTPYSLFALILRPLSLSFSTSLPLSHLQTKPYSSFPKPTSQCVSPLFLPAALYSSAPLPILFIPTPIATTA